MSEDDGGRRKRNYLALRAAVLGFFISRSTLWLASRRSVAELTIELQKKQRKTRIKCSSRGCPFKIDVQTERLTLFISLVFVCMLRVLRDALLKRVGQEFGL